MRKLNKKRLLILTCIPLGIGSIFLIGWLVRFIPAPEGFWYSNELPIVVDYFTSGLLVLLFVLLVATIGVLGYYGIKASVNWIYPKTEDKK